MHKISFVGDIMCELPLLRAYNRFGIDVFHEIFDGTQELLSKSDYIVGNLETVCAGEEVGYTKELYSFNTPDDFIVSLGKSCFDLMLTANNHCFDRGEKGLERTMNLLEANGINYSGSYFHNQLPIPIVSVKGTRIAIYGLTQSTNYFSNRVLVSETKRLVLNTIGPNDRNVYTGKVYSKINPSKTKKSILSEEQKIIIKKILGKTYNAARTDDYLDEELLAPYLSVIQKNISFAKDNSDILVVCPHMGGQFNVLPGAFSKYMMQWLISSGADAVIASHPHVVERAELIDGVPAFYSLGNYSMSPSSVYLLKENLPNYGIIAHLYIDDNKIIDTTYSIITIKEYSKHRLRIVPVNQVKPLDYKLEQDVAQIVSIVSGKVCGRIPIVSEYHL